LKLTELAAAHPGHLHVLPLDLSKERSIAGLAHEAGMLTDRLDALINNAGVLVTGERYGELAAKTFAETFATNVIGPLLLTQALTPLLEHGKAARIVNLSSDLGSQADTVAFNTPSYAISKAALNMVTRLTAAELGARGITVISLNPGWVRRRAGASGRERGGRRHARGDRWPEVRRRRPLPRLRRRRRRLVIRDGSHRCIG